MVFFGIDDLPALFGESGEAGIAVVVGIDAGEVELRGQRQEQAVNLLAAADHYRLVRRQLRGEGKCGLGVFDHLGVVAGCVGRIAGKHYDVAAG